MWWLLLPLSLFINNFSINLVSQSQRLSIISYMKGYCSYPYFNHSKSSLQNLESQSFTTENRLCLSYINNLYLYSVWISALFCCAAQLRPLAGNRLRPQTEVVFLASAAAISSYMSMCQCVNVYTNQMSISLDYPGQDRLPNWLSGAPQPMAIRGMNAFTPSYCWPRCWLCC